MTNAYISDFARGVQLIAPAQFSLNTILYFLNLRPINAKLTSLSDVHALK